VYIYHFIRSVRAPGAVLWRHMNILATLNHILRCFSLHQMNKTAALLFLLIYFFMFTMFTLFTGISRSASDAGLSR